MFQEILIFSHVSLMHVNFWIYIVLLSFQLIFLVLPSLFLLLETFGASKAGVTPPPQTLGN